MKCECCGAELEGQLEGGTAGITLYAPPAPVSDADFLILFGIWDQRRGGQFIICGACLAERLEGWHGGKPLL